MNLETQDAKIIAEFIEAACSPIGPEGQSHRHGGLETALAILDNYPRLPAQNVFVAAILGDMEQVKDFISKDHSMATVKGGPRNWDALTYLCFSRFLRLDSVRSANFVLTTKTLLEAGADPNTGFYEESHQPSPEWECVLYGAAGVAQHAGVTRVLLESGADPNDDETTYHSPETYNNDALQELVNTGKLTPDSLATMLLRKADFHDHDGMKLLLAAGADPHRMTRWHHTALHQALRRDNAIANIELLFDQGSDPNLPNRLDNQSAISIAIQRGRADVLTLFQKKGLIIKPVGMEQLLFACVMNNSAAVLEIATARPDWVQQVILQGGTFLSQFAGNASTAAMSQLFTLGVPVTARYNGDPYFGIPAQSTALHVAAWKSWYEPVRLLIDHGSPVNEPDGNGDTPLMLAVRACVDSYWKYRRNPFSVNALIKAGASLEGVSYPCGYNEVDTLLAKAL